MTENTASVDALAAEALTLREEGGFSALELRLGRERHSEDMAAIAAIRSAVGDDVELMVDYNQALHIGDAFVRCRAIDGSGAGVDRGAELFTTNSPATPSWPKTKISRADRRKLLWRAGPVQRIAPRRL